MKELSAQHFNATFVVHAQRNANMAIPPLTKEFYVTRHALQLFKKAIN
jgi:hypothetical protein